MKLKKINKYAEKCAEALYIYLNALQKKQSKDSIKKLKKKYESLTTHYNQKIWENGRNHEGKYSTKITIDLNTLQALTTKHLYDRHLDHDEATKRYYENKFSED